MTDDARRVARVCWAASRPSQILLVLVVYALGAKLADAKGTTVDPSELALGAALLVPVAASVHYANEYADRETDALTTRTPFSGGSGALERSGLSPAVVRRAAVVAGVAGVGAAGLALAAGALSPLAAGLLALGAAFGWQYSVGPLALMRRGLGEVDNAALGGLVLPAYGAAAVGGSPATAALACVPFALVVFANLLATHWPDRAADAAVGKRTLVVRLSRSRLRALYVLVVLAAGVALVALHPVVLPTEVVLASLGVAPLVAWGVASYPRATPLPSVVAMVGLAAAQLAAWCWLAL